MLYLPRIWRQSAAGCRRRASRWQGARCSVAGAKLYRFADSLGLGADFRTLAMAGRPDFFRRLAHARDFAPGRPAGGAAFAVALRHALDGPAAGGARVQRQPRPVPDIITWLPSRCSSYRRLPLRSSQAPSDESCLRHHSPLGDSPNSASARNSPLPVPMGPKPSLGGVRFCRGLKARSAIGANLESLGSPPASLWFRCPSPLSPGRGYLSSGPGSNASAVTSFPLSGRFESLTTATRSACKSIPIYVTRAQGPARCPSADRPPGPPRRP